MAVNKVSEQIKVSKEKIDAAKLITEGDLGKVPPELVESFNIIFYSSAEDAVFKALGVE